MKVCTVVIYELITALQLTTQLLYVFTYRSVNPHLTAILSTRLPNGELPSPTAIPETAYVMVRAARCHVAPCHTQQAPVRRSVPLVGRRFLIGRRRRLRRFLEVRDIGKVILLGHTDGQSQDHHLPFAGSSRDKQQNEDQRWEEKRRRRAGEDNRTWGGRGAEGTEGGGEVISGSDRKHKRPL